MTENRELASALMSCQDELSHMNEKLLLTEDAGIKLTTKCKELAAFTEPLINKTPTKLDMESVFKKITDLVDMQKDAEKSLVDHDRSRFQVSVSPPKKEVSDWQIYVVYQLDACIFLQETT